MDNGRGSVDNNGDRGGMDYTEKKMNMKAMLQKFGETTSIKGIPRAMKSKDAVLQILWVIALITGLGYRSFQVYSLVHKYLQYEYQQLCKQTACRMGFMMS